MNQISRYFHQLFNLPQPNYATPEVNTKAQPLEDNWEDIILSLYDPSLETQTLKNANALKDCFKKVRKAHHFRHNFSVYPLQIHDTKINALLGKV